MISLIRQGLLKLGPTQLCYYSIKATKLERDSLQVHFTNRGTLQYPYLYLQDNCTCADCFHESSRSRLRKLTDLKLDGRIVKVEQTDTEIHCTWDNGHESRFTEEWLLDRRFTEENAKRRKRVPRDDPVLVGADVQFPNDSFDGVMQDEQRLLGMLEELASKGLFLLDGAPCQVGVLRRLADRIGFIRLTHYGLEFTVKSEPNAVNLAYTSARLGVHTDLPYYAYPPGVQLLHCIRQYHGEERYGGMSHLVDGFRVAKQMQQRHPQMYELLCTVPLEFYDVGSDYTRFFKVHHSPTFVVNPEKGALERIVYSNQVLSSYMPVPRETVQPVYTALKLFTDLCYAQDNLIQFKLKEGQILLFDNWRLLHGREGFDPSKGHRHLEGCYIDWDEVYSRINVITEQMRLPNASEN